jgi:glycosyltransferase involved in cell wall biosynthesis
MKSYSDNLKLLPNSIEIGNYRFRLRNRLKPRLIWLRSFHELYNPSLAPKVISILNDTFSDIKLTMVGPDKGDGTRQLTEITAKELNVTDRLVIEGGIPKEDVPKLMNTGDIFLNTTNWDNTPISVIEAMACGLCVVSTNVCGIPYLLEHEKDALLVPPDDPEAMAAAVHRLIMEPNLAERLSRNARHKVEQFDWSVILPQWESLLLSVAER